MEKTLTIEESLLRQVKKKKRKRRNKRIARFALLISLIVLVVFYLTSDMSKVKSLTVKNNIHYSDSQILELAGIDYDSNYILTNSFYVNYKLEKNSLIADAKLKKDLHGGFTIYIEEEKVIGSLKENPQLLLIQGKGIENISNKKFIYDYFDCNSTDEKVICYNSNIMTNIVVNLSGYWLLSIMERNGVYYAMDVDSYIADGEISRLGNAPNEADINGVRPVITVLISDIG